jgi:hypothetical protein
VPGPTKALLTPRFAATAPDFTPGFGIGSPGSGRGQLGGHDLMHDRNIRLDPEYGGIQFDIALGRPIAGE